MRKPNRIITMTFAALSLGFLSCSGDEGGNPTDTRGGSGGQSTGGRTDGGAGSADLLRTGGVLSTGGFLSTGGILGTGGVTNMGGSSGGGGSTATGGSAIGGTAVLGGSTSTGGKVVLGGSIGTGGTAASGGSIGTGGTAASGGATGTGGAVGSGGGGGSPSTGGNSGSGGAGTGFNPCPASGNCRILPLGDSITEGYHGANGAYRVPLFKKALTNKKHITFVGSLSNGPATVEGETFPTQHEGHVGFSLLAIVAEAPAPSQDSTPHIVLMMGGTNDVRYASGAAAAPQNANQVLETLFKKYPDALIVMAQIPPMSNSAWNAAAMAFNATLPATVSKHAGAGKHVVLVDMHTGFPSSGLADGVHPNSTGCEHIANTWYQAISDFLR